MARARLGDDVYGEDPTVNALEALAAERVGKDAGLFVASGTMGNLVAMLAHANRGDEAIVGVDAHTYRSEAGGMSTLGGIVPRPLPTNDIGRMDLSEVEAAIRPDDPHYPRSRLVLTENTYAIKHGYPISADYFAGVNTIAERHGLAVHLDGARLFNAAVALDVDAREITQHVDSVSFCLSKGLCAPAGSLLCGPTEFIKEARRARKVLGGGMRQAGVLAAAGIVALNEMVGRLASDHACAQTLAKGLAQIPGVLVEPEMVKTNMVFFGLHRDVPLTTSQVASQMREKGDIWVGTSGRDRLRAVTHYWIGHSEVEAFLDVLEAVLGDV